jgi:hypothetical protein
VVAIGMFEQCVGEHSTNSELVYYFATLHWCAWILVAAIYAQLGFGHAYMDCCCGARSRYFEVFFRFCTLEFFAKVRS